jgi:glycosyltransferase involved in cell wall biosynthesis/GT2 family glycosyltransferase
MSTNERIIVVLGMHRSGSSSLTKGLEALGISLGGRLMPADAYNPTGYWEDVDFYELNQAMLASLGYEWDHLLPPSREEIDRLLGGDFFRQAATLLRAKLADSPLLGVKDPRFCVLLPFWRRVFAHCGTGEAYVLCLRHPNDVAESLFRRNQQSHEKFIWLWISHVLTAVTNLKGADRLVVDYEDLLREPAAQMARVAETLSLAPDKKKLADYGGGFLDPTLNHQGQSPPPGDISFPPLAREIYEKLRAVAGGQIGWQDLERVLPSWQNEYAAAHPLLKFAAQNEKLARDFQHQCAELSSQVGERQALELARREAEVERAAAEADRQAAETARDLALTSRQAAEAAAREAHAESQQLQAAIQAERGHHAELAGHLESVRAERHAAVRQLHSQLVEAKTSTSWKLSLPIRVLGGAFRLRDGGWERIRRALRIRRQHGNSGMIEVDWYYENNPDVRSIGWHALDHFAWYGAFEGRPPHSRFDPAAYIRLNPDVAASGLNPVLHYALHGFFSARPCWDSTAEQTDPVQRAEPAEYADWIRATELTPENPRARDEAADEPSGPLISILLPVYRVEPRFLERTIHSVQAQTYARWELCVVMADPENGENLSLLREAARGDLRIRVETTANGGISANTNHALAMAGGEFVGLLDHDDELGPEALAAMVAAIANQPEADLLYSDKDNIDEASSVRRDALFKPEWSPEVLYSVNYLTHFNLLRRRLVEEVGGLRPMTDGAQDWDLFLRVSERARAIVRVPGIHYHWRIHPASTSSGLAAKPYALEAQLRTIESAVARRGLPARVEPSADSGFRLCWQVPEATPIRVFVEAFTFPAKSSAELVRTLLSTGRENLRVTVLAGAGAAAGLAELLGHDTRVEVVPGPAYPTTAHYAEAIGRAEVATGVLFFISGQVANVSPEWLDELAGWVLLHPGVGLASGLILDAGGDVVESGLVVDVHGRGSPLFRGAPLRQWGWLGGPLWYRNFSACSPWFAAVNAADYRSVGGLDRRRPWPEAFVRLGTALRSRGRRGVLDPQVRVTLADGALPSVPPFDSSLADDPYFHPAFESVVPLRLAGSAPPEDCPGAQPAQSEYSAEASVHAEWCRAYLEDLAAPQQHPERVGGGPGAGWCNWLLPSLDHPAYGGAMTIFRLADFLTRRRGLRQRFLFIGPVKTESICRKVTDLYPALASAEYLSVGPADAPTGYPPADFTFATLWMTAYTLLRIRNTGLKLYFIQDYEPLFYPAGSIYAQAELTYRMGFLGVTNTRPLREIYERDHGGVAVAFTPQIDPEIFHCTPSRRGNAVKRILFYARPGHPRNGFEIAAVALRLVKAKFGDQVEILTAGADFNPAGHGLDGVVTPLGLLDYARTAVLYRSCDLGFVMMMTRHPSYLPLELMACGTLLVTNANPTNSWLLQDGENCLLAPAHAELLAARMIYAVEHYEELHEVRLRASRQIATSHQDWDGEFERVLDFLDEQCTPGSHSVPPAAQPLASSSVVAPT